MQSRLTKCFALGGMLALLCTSQTIPVQSRNLLAVGKPGQSGIAAAITEGRKGDDSTSFKGADGSGTLVAMLGSGKQLGQCALKHTDVSCDISGYIARVTVKQTFHNPYKDKIEALYTFPLSDSGAVDEMLMKVGDRTIHGTIKKREEAKQIYEQARANGQVASLLDQERTNIFTQSVANIEPGKEIEITIKYVETLPFEKGKYSFAFPTVVGPRFIPSSGTAGAPNTAVNNGTGWAGNTDLVPDASRITPPVAPQGERAGHDISINVHLNAGMAMSDLSSKLHQVNIANNGAHQANISLVDKNTIPNKDFVLSWNVAQDDLKSGYLTYRDPQAKDGFFTLMLVPPKRVTADKVAPKEMIFVIDCSGSQGGPPWQKCKETMNYILDHMNADDTFQIIAFNSTTRTFAEKPEKVSSEMKARAHEFIESLQANGGTWMAPAVQKACDIPADNHRLRIVTFMTDGYVGNDFEILSMVKKLRGVSRWFPFGTGNSVNRMLIDGIAKEGGGEPDYVLLNTTGEEAGKKFYDRIASPVLTDVKLNFNGVQLKDVYPREISDVWAERPLYFKGKYTAGGAGTITLTGYSGGKPYEQKVAVNFPDNNKANPGIASLWARAKVDRLMAEDYSGAQKGAVNKELKDEIVETALAHHIMTQYTSFVAVDEKTVTKNGKLQTITVPVEVPDGVQRSNIFGKDSEAAPMQAYSNHRLKVSGLNRRVAYLQAPGGFNGPAAGGGGGGSYNGQGYVGGKMIAQGAAFSSYGGGAVALPASVPMPMMAAAPKQKAPINRLEQKEEADKGLHFSTSPIASKSRSDGLVNSENINEPQEKPLADDRDATGNKKSADQLSILAHANKLSQSAQLLLKNPTSPVTSSINGITRKGDKVMVIIKVNKITSSQKAALKALGLDIVKGKDVAGEIRGLIKISKLVDLANLDFVLSVLLDSDRK